MQGVALGVGAIASGGSVTGAATALGVDANNRQLHPEERTRAQKLAAASGGKYTAEQIEEQMRLMGNTTNGGAANTLAILTSAEAISNNLSTDPGMPKVSDGKVVVEVAGQANADIQQFIMTNTKDGAGYIPGTSPYTPSNVTLNRPSTSNVPAATASSTVKCAYGDASCASGVGMSQGRGILPDYVSILSLIHI